MVLDCRLIRGGSMSMSFDDSTYNIGLLVYERTWGFISQDPSVPKVNQLHVEIF